MVVGTRGTHMVIAVLADIVEVLFGQVSKLRCGLGRAVAGGSVCAYIVFATSTDALLCVYCTLQLGHRLSLANCSEENGLELVHARVREEQGGVIVRDDRRRGHCGARQPGQRDQDEVKPMHMVLLKTAMPKTSYSSARTATGANGNASRAEEGQRATYRSNGPSPRKSPRRSCGRGARST